MSKSRYTALIVEGGAMRSVFSAGLLDGLLEQQFNPFDFYIGVSAGAGNLLTYLAGTPGKSLQIFQDFALRKEFISYARFICGGHLIDLDWLSDIIFADSRLNLEAAYCQARPLYVGLTEVTTGKPLYIKTTADNIKCTLKASMALPVFYQGFPEINNRPMTDGSVAEGIPVAEAIRMGAKRIMVIRSRPEPYMKKDTPGHQFIRWKMKKHPALTKVMRNRIEIHKNSLTLIRNPPSDVKLVEICPSESFTIGHFNRSRKHILQGYQNGLDAAGNAIEQWLSIISQN